MCFVFWFTSLAVPHTSHEGAASPKFAGTEPVAPEIMLPTLLPKPEKGLKDINRLLLLLLLVVGEATGCGPLDLLLYWERAQKLDLQSSLPLKEGRPKYDIGGPLTFWNMAVRPEGGDTSILYRSNSVSCTYMLFLWLRSVRGTVGRLAFTNKCYNPKARARYNHYPRSDPLRKNGGTEVTISYRTNDLKLSGW